MPTKAHLTIYLIRSSPPFEFDVYSKSEIDDIPEFPGVICFAKPKPESSAVIADDWGFYLVECTDDLRKEATGVTSVVGYDSNIMILTRIYNKDDLNEHKHISFALQKALGWL